MRARTPYVGAAVVLAVMCTAGVAPAQVLRGAVVGAGATPASGIGGNPNGPWITGTLGQPAVGTSGNGQTQAVYGYWAFGGPNVLAVDDGDADPGTPGPLLPTRLELGPARPNPAMGPVRFSLALPTASSVSMIVLDVQGRALSRVEAGRMAAGIHDITWDTRGVHAGVHFVRLLVEGREVATRRVVVIR